MVLDPTCGDGAFLRSAAATLSRIPGSTEARSGQLVGVDLDDHGMSMTSSADSRLRFIQGDFLDLSPPDGLFGELPWVDAIVGNPPFIRFQLHNGEARRRSIKAALRQGVRLSGLASSWAGVLVHAAAFLKPDGRLAMVLPAELLSVGYAEPVRRWLRGRFSDVKLVMAGCLG